MLIVTFSPLLVAYAFVLWSVKILEVRGTWNTKSLSEGTPNLDATSIAPLKYPFCVYIPYPVILSEKL